MGYTMDEWRRHRSGDRYGFFRLNDVGDQRWQAALAHFAEGGAIAFDDVGFTLDEPGRLLISPFWSDSRLPTQREAERAFERADACLAFLEERDPSFRKLVQARHVDMDLLANDGMGLIAVAHKRAGVVTLA
jgi:hypothetical protein